MDIIEGSSVIVIKIGMRRLKGRENVREKIEENKKIREAYEKIIRDSMERGESMLACYERELLEGRRKNRISKEIYKVLYKNRVEIKEYYSECLGLGLGLGLGVGVGMV